MTLVLCPRCGKVCHFPTRVKRVNAKGKTYWYLEYLHTDQRKTSGRTHHYVKDKDQTEP